MSFSSVRHCKLSFMQDMQTEHAKDSRGLERASTHIIEFRLCLYVSTPNT